MSQGNWGGGGGPGWGGPGGGGGGGYGPPGGAPPGGGGYGPPPGAPPGGGGYGPPPGGAPPGGGGYGPPPGGFGGPPGGAPPPPGGFGGPPGGAPPPPGGFGGPPGGGGYGPPPGGGGYGPPPGGGGYGPPPGAGGFGGPPGGGFGPPPGMGMGSGQRALFTGDGGKLLGTFLIFSMGTGFAAFVTSFVFQLIGGLIASATRTPELAIPFALLGALGAIAIGTVGSLMLANKVLEFRYENLVIDGQRCRYVGTAGGLFKAAIVPYILTALTFGIYAPWMICRLVTWTYENVEVNGQRGRLTFHGDGGTLLGKYLLGMILTICTLYIYGAWFANDLFAFFWESSKIDGRGFTFKKDPGGFLGTYIINMILNAITCSIYQPWALCNFWRWETERVA